MNFEEELKMLEARLYCKVSQYILEDLDLTMKQGEVIFLDRKQALKSKDLDRAKTFKAIEVTWVKRFNSVKDAPKLPAPPYVRKMTPPHIKEETVPIKEDSAALKESLESSLQKHIDTKLQALENNLASKIERALSKNIAESPGQKIDASTMASFKAIIDAALTDALSQSITVERPSKAKEERRDDNFDFPDDMPIFIPKDLVSGNKATAHINIEASSSSGSEDLEAASAALKAARKKK